uniref:Uncharacterized protein n=1 Tax=Euplotes harpa TaxID=151035 RepID=A0A7S3JNG1_9SPIT|mmetsp:Transcript_7375/g.8337  ORF Transcript_7375/g.8337 Transcript_7375/m.8337 type:complete len:110 (+) Transcript_7375:20-349(+)|eukprot:CAMPEP_0168329086 /NCGR_PEP_ID=MMETSP0213-20121227/6894_1 /TAXON_ID=151035 /ORGANISM="Euplotes harpa, Strain FSP1.4" /LENGTH=109 /DNA_ID=CAMNT_0008332335 /DNA_START=12 /DNA_END=341 /DNA_ORIENTATION=-
MKFVFALLIIACVMIGTTHSKDSKSEVQQLVQVDELSGDQTFKSGSILEAVNMIKSRKMIRSLGEEGVGDLDENYYKRSYWQFCIWVPILIFVAMFYSVMSIVYMDFAK